MNWQIVYARQAQKDAGKLTASSLKAKAQDLLGMIALDPPSSTPNDASC